jgi:nitroreductase
MDSVTPDPPLRQLVDRASRSPSGHNAQPWTIVQAEGPRLVLRSDPSRWLRMVDPTNRELLLSLGALIETIRQAAPSVGYRIDLEVLAVRYRSSGSHPCSTRFVDRSGADPVPGNHPNPLPARGVGR